MTNEEKFKEELRNLMDKYEVDLVGHDHYNSDDHYRGTDYYFSGHDIDIHVGDV